MLSNTAVPRYYAEFRNKVLRGEIPVCREISMEMNRIDALVADRNIWYDDEAVEGWIRYCEAELTLTDGDPLVLLDSFKLWGEQVFIDEVAESAGTLGNELMCAITARVRRQTG